MKIDNFRNSAHVDVLAYVDLKNNLWLNWVTWHANPLQISSQWVENWGFSKYHPSCWPWAYVNFLPKKQQASSLCQTLPCGEVCQKEEAYCFWGQKVNNLGEISEILNFHPIHLKFEEDLYFRSLNSITNYDGGPHRPKGQHRPKYQNCQFSSDSLEIWRAVAHLVIQFNHQLFLRSNLF